MTLFGIDVEKTNARGETVLRKVVDDPALSSFVAERVSADVSGPDIVQWGDSLTAQMGSAVLAAATGRTVRNAGVGGESSTGIAARQGAAPYTLLPVGGQIPASGGVAVQIVGSSSWPLLQGDGIPDGAFTGSLAGVPGTITLTQPSGPSYSHLADDVYTFTRTAPGVAVAVTRPEPFYTDFSAARRDDIAIIWAGRNDYSSLDTVRGNVRAMVDYLTALHVRYLVVSVTNGRGEGVGSAAYTAIVALNAALKNDYGRRFLDVRSYLVSYGLEDAGIPPTPADVADKAANITPSSLRSDAVHFTTAGQIVVANQIARRLAELGWTPSWTPQAFPAVTDLWALRPNLVGFNPDAEVNLTGWAVTGATGLARDTAVPFGGLASVRFTTTTDGQGVNAYANATGAPRMPVNPDKAIAFRGRARGPVGANLRLMIHFYSAADAYLGNQAVVMPMTGDWITLSKGITGPAVMPPAGAAGGILQFNQQGSTGGDFWVDSVEVYQPA